MIRVKHSPFGFGSLNVGNDLIASPIRFRRTVARRSQSVREVKALTDAELCLYKGSENMSKLMAIAFAFRVYTVRTCRDVIVTYKSVAGSPMEAIKMVRPRFTRPW